MWKDSKYSIILLIVIFVIVAFGAVRIQVNEQRTIDASEQLDDLEKLNQDAMISRIENLTEQLFATQNELYRCTAKLYAREILGPMIFNETRVDAIEMIDVKITENTDSIFGPR